MNEVPISLPELVPVFPLPEVVLFPRQVLPLHIFEPRYRAMVADALEGDRILAVALLKPNYEPEYFTLRAPIHRLVGVGRIIASDKPENGNFNILLQGEARAHVVEELPGRPYRYARIEPVRPCCNSNPTTQTRLRHELCEAIHRSFAGDPEPCEKSLNLVKTPLSLSELTDLVAGALPVAGELRQCLLGELDACERARMLIDHIETLGRVAWQARTADTRENWKLN